MTRVFVVIAVLLAGISAQAAVSLKAATLKVVSAYQNQSLTLRGSALGFLHDGAAYVVTSDHVTLHDNDDKIHYVLDSVGRRFECEYLVSDFGRGLALLKVASGLPSGLPQWPTLAELKVALPAVDTRAFMMGYPAMADSLVRDGSGKIASVDRLSSVFVQVTKMIEVQGGHAEFGMSGGVVASADDTFVGILSHQIYSEEGGIRNTILVLPSFVVVNWLNAYFANPNQPGITLVQTTEQATSGISPSFVTGNLFFTYLDAYGTGKKVLHLSDTSQRHTTELFGAKAGHLENYERHILSHETCGIYILGFRRRGEVGSWVAGAGYVGTIRQVEDPDLEPMTDLFCNESSDAKNKLPKHHSELSRLIQESLGGEHIELLRVLRSYVEYINERDGDRNMSYVHVKPSDLEALITDQKYAKSWQSLETKGTAKKLRLALEAWIETMRVLTI